MHTVLVRAVKAAIITPKYQWYNWVSVFLMYGRVLHVSSFLGMQLISVYEFTSPIPIAFRFWIWRQTRGGKRRWYDAHLISWSRVTYTPSVHIPLESSDPAYCQFTLEVENSYSWWISNISALTANYWVGRPPSVDTARHILLCRNRLLAIMALYRKNSAHTVF